MGVRYRPDLIALIARMPQLTEAMLPDEETVKQWFERLKSLYLEDQPKNTGCSIELFRSSENEYFGGRINITVHGVENINIFGPEFFISTEYRKLIKLENQHQLGPDACVKRGENRKSIKSLSEAFEWLMQDASRGLHVQRYKGLGEMNPEQLWETTMDAKQRILSQVRIEDAIAADEIFTTLMGDQVEPRRMFIEQNALSVENLDT